MRTQMNERPEALVSVDIEASGPSPSTGSLLSIGACLIEDASVDFYVELKPNVDFEWDVSARNNPRPEPRTPAQRDGLEPALQCVNSPTGRTGPARQRRPVFVGFNAPFDWMFVADYLWRYVGRNPYGISAIDLKSYYMAREKVATWERTRRTYVDKVLGIEPDHNHHALDDAKGQARLATVLLDRHSR